MIGIGLMRPNLVSHLQLLLLLHINQNESYGYDILKTLRAEFTGIWEPKSGTLYPALRNLEKRGLILAHKDRDPEYYRLTEKKKSLLEELGVRFELDQKIGARYFRTIIKWMPATLRDRILGVLCDLSIDNVDVFPPLHQFFDKTLDRELRYEILECMKVALTTRLGTVQRLYEEMMEEEVS
jgi:DNA-binding PadR family transcriptional regulator